ncbi:MAG: YhjD/YihY/BrkB family envelope integrity protein [Candidatus Latescibacterota bacterium]
MATLDDRNPRWAKGKAAAGRIRHFLLDGIWRLNLTEWPRLLVVGVRYLKVLILLMRQFFADELLMRASALTYSSLLAIVPFLAVIFFVLKAFGLHMDLAPALSSLLSPMGAQGDQVSAKILEFVENSQTGALGVAGFATLLLTAFSILSSIETSYNEIWHVHRMRTWLGRMVGYMVLLVVAPFLVLVVLAVTASVSSIDLVRRILAHSPSAAVLEVGLKLTPYVLSCLLFTLLVFSLPNARVKLKAAMVGGFLSGIMWELSNWGFARFVVRASQGSAQEVLFAGFAALPLFLLWLYLSWVIALLGAQLGYVVQHAGVMEWRELERRYGYALRRFVGVRATLGIVRDFVTSGEAPSLGELSRENRVPAPILCDILEPLVAAGMLIRAPDDGEHFLPAQDPAAATVGQLLSAFEGQTTLPEGLYAQDPFGRSVERLLRQMDGMLEDGAGTRSLREAALLAGEGSLVSQADNYERGSSGEAAVIAEV